MKRIIFVFIIFIPYYTSSQSFKLGGSFDLMLENKDLAHELGPTVNIEYLFESLPISINGGARIHYSAINNETYKFSWSYNYIIYSIVTSIKYYPFSWDIEPYIACGLSYNFINKNNSSGHPYFNNGYIVGQNIVEHNFSSEITGGLILSAKTPVNLFFEVTQTFNKPEYDLIFIDYDNNKTTRKEKFNFSALLIKLEVRFGL